MKAFKFILGILVFLVLAFLTLGMLNPVLEYESRTQVEASVEHTFAVFNNPDRIGEWQEGFKSIENISGGDNKVGSKWRLIFEEDGEVMEIIEEVLAFEENELFAFTMDSDALTAEVNYALLLRTL